MTDIPTDLPGSVKAWQDAIASASLTEKTVHTAELASASKMNYTQFLLLRVLWVIHPNHMVQYLPEKVRLLIPRATELLNGLASWNTYLGNFGSSRSPEGTFSLVRLYQIEVEKSKGDIRPDSFDTPIANRTRSHTSGGLIRKMKALQLETPTKQPTGRPKTPVMSQDNFLFPEPTPSPQSAPVTPANQVPEEYQKDMFVPTRDEQVVNTALVLLLNALSMHFNIVVSWTMHRKAFVAAFEEARYEARMDGYLDDGNQNPYALVEVKPIPRAEKTNLIQVQEGAQMVSWIKNDTDAPSTKPRLHVSQDRHEIFITVAEYDDDYVAYLTHKPTDKPLSLLTMHQIGPWNIQSKSEMKSLGPILLAITLYADSEVRKLRGSLRP